MNFNMKKVSFIRMKKAVIPARIHISEVEKSVLKVQLKKAVEKLKEAREELRQAIQAIMMIKEDGDDLAEQAIAAAAEPSTSDSIPLILSMSAKAIMKKEAAKPLLLLRSD